MVKNNHIYVEVAYATKDREYLASIEVEKGSSIRTVILQSKILSIFLDIDLAKQKVGIFGKVRSLTDQVEDGDRVEIYRSLIINPKEARRKKI